MESSRHGDLTENFKGDHSFFPARCADLSVSLYLFLTTPYCFHDFESLRDVCEALFDPFSESRDSLNRLTCTNACMALSIYTRPGSVIIPTYAVQTGFDRHRIDRLIYDHPVPTTNQHRLYVETQALGLAML